MIRIRYVITLLLLTVALTVMGGELTWFDGKRPVSYSVAKRHSKVVDVALGMFGDDMLAVTGMRPERKRHGIIEIVEENRGIRERVLFESKEKDGNMSGYTGNYIRIVRPYDASLVGRLTDIII